MNYGNFIAKMVWSASGAAAHSGSEKRSDI